MLILTVTTDFVLKANPTTSSCTYSAHWQLHRAPSLHHLACRRGDPRPKKRPLLGHQALVRFQICLHVVFRFLVDLKLPCVRTKTSNLCKDKNVFKLSLANVSSPKYTIQCWTASNILFSHGIYYSKILDRTKLYMCKDCGL